MSYIYKFFGAILDAIYSVIPNFGWAIIIFTVLVRVLLLPLMIKQQKSMVNMQKIQPELTKLQKKYANDQQKLNEETMKLYQKYDVNPMGGCLPLLIQMPILLAVYRIIQQPITYLLKIDLPNKVFEVLKQTATDTELNIVAFVTNNFEKAQSLLDKANLNFDISQIKINFDFLGLNLGYSPQHCDGNYILFIIPVISVITSFLTTKLSKAGLPKNEKEETNAQTQQMQTMNYIFPLMTGYFCYILPAAMGLYWIVGNLWQMGQTYVMNRLMSRSKNEDVIEVKVQNPQGNKKENNKKKK